MNVLSRKLRTYLGVTSSEAEKQTIFTIFGETVSLSSDGNTLEKKRQLDDLKTIYEPFLASRVLPKAGLCLDVGAGVGWFAIPFAMAFREWTVLCLEPDEEQFRHLQDNVRKYHLKNVICINAGLHPDSEAAGHGVDAFRHGKVRTMPALYQRLLSLGPKLAPVSQPDISQDETVLCPSLSLDIFSSLQPDLVRVDAPGCERDIAQALSDVPVPFVVGRLYSYVKSCRFSLGPAAGDREHYLVHNEHALRRDFEDNFPDRHSRLDVVVAMYNAREFIRECVDSVLADDNPDIRVVVVDDGSTDGCGDLVAKTYRNNDRVQLLRKANGGCASARNHGRRHSDASHIAFIDADDRVDPQMFTSLLEVARYTGCFVAEAEFKTFTTGPDGVDVFKASYEAAIFADPGMHRLGEFHYDWIPGSQIITGQPTIWRRIHRRDFLDRKNIWFPEHVRAFDDQIFQLFVGHYADHVAHVRDQAYHYRQHPAQDIKQGDERHFYSFNMFRSAFLRALDEGWRDITPIVHALVNTMQWSYGNLRSDLKPIYAEAAVEFLAILNKTFGSFVTEGRLRRTGIPGLSYLVARKMAEMNQSQVSYAMMRLESWRWQPEFVHMMKAIESKHTD